MDQIKSFENFLHNQSKIIHIDNEIELVSDYLLEYLDEWKLKIVKDFKVIDKDKDKDKINGIININRVSTKNFSLNGFPDRSSGVLIKILFYNPPDNEKKWKNDMYLFIKRCINSLIGYSFETYIDETSNDKVYYIALFK